MVQMPQANMPSRLRLIISSMISDPNSGCDAIIKSVASDMLGHLHDARTCRDA
jgi:hypothetical protein